MSGEPKSPARGPITARDWFVKGLREGHRIMLVCIDTFDFFRGDEGGGVFHCYFDSVEEARAYAAKNLKVSWKEANDVLDDVYDLQADFEAQEAEGSENRLARFLG
jgi:hypothetical protein